MPEIDRVDLNNLTNIQLDELIKEDPDKFVACPIEKKHLVKINQLQSHISDCLRSSVHLGFRECRYCPWHVCQSHVLAAHEDVCLEKDLQNTAVDASAKMRAAIQDLFDQTVGS